MGTLYTGVSTSHVVTLLYNLMINLQINTTHRVNSLWREKKQQEKVVYKIGEDCRVETI